MQAVTNARIIQIRAEDGLSRSKLAEITGYSRSYIDNWLVDSESPNWREAPQNAVRLLELETGRRAPAYVKGEAGRLPVDVRPDMGRMLALPPIAARLTPPLNPAYSDELSVARKAPKRRPARKAKKAARRAAKKARKGGKRRG